MPVDSIITRPTASHGGKAQAPQKRPGMREFETDLEQIARVSKMLAFGFWCVTIAAIVAAAYVLLVWLPRHGVL